MNNDYVFIDSDALIGKIYPDDAHHEKASEVFGYLKEQGVKLMTTNLVIMETATVLSHKQGQALGVKFLSSIEKGEVPVVYVGEELFRAGLEIFREQTKKGTSVVDCVNVAVMRKWGITKIFSFDEVYKKQFGLELLGSE